MLQYQRAPWDQTPRALGYIARHSVSIVNVYGCFLSECLVVLALPGNKMLVPEVEFDLQQIFHLHLVSVINYVLVVLQDKA